MKRIGFYALVIVIVLNVLAGSWNIVAALTIIVVTLYSVWIYNGHHRFLEIRDKIYFFNEMFISDAIHINRLKESIKTLIETIAELEKEKNKIDQSDEKKLKQVTGIVDLLNESLSRAQYYEKHAMKMIDIKKSTCAVLLNMNYQQYLKENWLYYYRPSEDMLKPIYDEVKKVKAGTFFVRLEQINGSDKVSLVKVVKDLCDLNLREAKDKVDAVQLGSMSVLIKDIKESEANHIKEMLGMFGGIAVVVDNKSLI